LGGAASRAGAAVQCLPLAMITLRLLAAGVS